MSRLSAVLVLAALSEWIGLVWAQPQPAGELPAPRPVDGETQAAATPGRLTLSASAAVQWALRNNPTLATLRKQRGIAEAAVQIAKQYPFNPIVQDFVWYGNGPAAAGVTNHVFNEHTMRLDLEIYRQGRYRRGMARAALTRTEWEIAAQELVVSVQAARTFNTLLYRHAKYNLLEETAKFQEETAEELVKIAEQGKVTSADVVLARADLAEARNALGPGRSLLVVAENDFRRALGLVNEAVNLDGTLEKAFRSPEPPVLVQAAFERRPDLHAFEFAVQEAEQRLRLEVANRWGNPSLGPATEVNETSVYFVGMWLIWSPPIINTRKGEIRQREAERARAIQAVHQSEVQIQQDVFAALARLNQAERVVEGFRTDTLPELRRARESLTKLFLSGQAGVDLARLIDIRRRLLRARDFYLDALWEMAQAQADLAAAVADLSFVGCTPAATAQGRDAASAQGPQ